MRRYSQRHSLSTVSELNFTPMLDLAFVLLIIFMITAPLLERNLDLITPTSRAATDAVDPAKVITLAVDKNRQYTLNAIALAYDQIPAGIATLRQKNPQMAVVIRPHKDLPVQEVVALMDILKKAEITQVGLLSLPASE